MIPLFEQYHALREKLPYVSLGDFPTPVEKLDRLGRDIGLDQFYIKRDDLSSKVYGGNKVRKLEFLLGDALRARAKEVLTFGYAGSNHALATAVYAREVGLRSISMLMPQPNAHYVRRNLLLSHYCEAELHLHRNMPLLYAATFCQLARHRLKTGRFPQIVPPGGSSPLGTAGYVNAALELGHQIAAGQLPEPDRIYVAMGTMGTVVGLMLGLRAAGLKSEVIPVVIVPKRIAGASKAVTLFMETNSLLHSLDPLFPMFPIAESDIVARVGFLGDGYAHFTAEGMEAVRRMKIAEGIKLEGTYTGKTLAALIAEVEEEDLRDKVVLFWNTYNSRDFSELVDTIDYRELPRCFFRYFEEEVQALDEGL
jgi:1-aminocyclopropane-1-carboxylate deaminase/D-cysteine desulfhydrase-like pyridoxal-dependent ACC family enzyme